MTRSAHLRHPKLRPGRRCLSLQLLSASSPEHALSSPEPAHGSQLAQFRACPRSTTAVHLSRRPARRGLRIRPNGAYRTICLCLQATPMLTCSSPELPRPQCKPARALCTEHNVFSSVRMRSPCDPRWSPVYQWGFAALQRLRSLPGGAGHLQRLQLGLHPDVTPRSSESVLTVAKGELSYYYPFRADAMRGAGRGHNPAGTDAMNSARLVLVPCPKPRCPALVERFTLLTSTTKGCAARGCAAKFQPARYSASQLAFAGDILSGRPFSPSPELPSSALLARPTPNTASASAAPTPP